MSSPRPTRLTALAGWGRASHVLAEELLSEDLAAITRDVVLTRGLGRSYGDASLPAREGARVAGSRLANRILAFDPASGVLGAEAGLALVDMHQALLPRGFFTPVSPGTQQVTLGGLVAADVHGKDHHRAGAFGRHVRRLRLRVADGTILDCSPEVEPALFRATIGGLGLTGHILEVEIQLLRVPSPWILRRVTRALNLEFLLDQLRSASAEWPYTVAWVDGFARGASFGRGVVILGRWAEPDEAAPAFAPRGRPLRLPLDAPGWLLHPRAVELFNAVYYRSQRPGQERVHPETFFYPLDVIGDWNRAYGKLGFIQYQCVLPHSPGNRLVLKFMRRAAELGASHYLGVIKDMGAEGSGLLSFPRPGFTIAIDLPFRPNQTQWIVDRLNEEVLDAGGRIYLAKDGLTRREHFRAMEPRLGTFDAVRRRWDPERKLESALSRRLLGDAA